MADRKTKGKLSLKFWPSSSALTASTGENQETPKATPNANPFDNMHVASPSVSAPPPVPNPANRSPLATPTHHPLLKSPFGPPSPGLSTAAASEERAEVPTAAFGTFASAIRSSPNVLSLKAPMDKSARSSSTPDPPSLGAQAVSGTTATSTAATTGSSQPGPSRGQIHVKLIQARGLSVRSISTSKPYVVVQFEQSEFVSRDPTDETDKEIKGTAISRTASSTALSALGAIESKAAAHANKASLAPESPIAKSPIGSLFGRLNASNPVWKHQVLFDVTSEHSLITFNVYDRAVEDQGFLGTLQVKPVLIHDHTVDQWYKLRPYDNEPVTGDMRVQITYEQLKTKRALTPRDFEFLKLIGRGTFGRVFQVRKRDTKRIYAMKVLSKKEIVAKKEVAHTIGERKILQTSLMCPFLVGLKFSFQTDTDLYLVTDFKSGGELFWHLQRETRFSEERARFYIAELILALEHLHKYDIVYRDLKPENILLDATGHVALCDFGLSKPDLRSDELTTTFCGTTEYLAPEILLDEHGYSKIVDFWSLGVLLFEMCCGWSPFYAEDTQQMYKNICFGKIRFPKGVICEEGKMFVKGLLNRNPKHRLGAQRDAAELKEHPFFNIIDWNALSLKQVTPPFKPVVESDESTNNFDPEFTGTDISDFASDMTDDEDKSPDEEDPSEAWVSKSFSSSNMPHTPNGPLGSERRGSNLSRSGSSSSLSARLGASLGISTYPSNGSGTATPMPNPKGNRAGSNDSGGATTGRSQAVEIKTKKKRKNDAAGTPLTNSVQENFRGFTFSGGESVTTGIAAMATGRHFDEDEDQMISDMNGEGRRRDGVDEESFNDFGVGMSAGRYSRSDDMNF